MRSNILNTYIVILSYWSMVSSSSASASASPWSSACKVQWRRTKNTNAWIASEKSETNVNECIDFPNFDFRISIFKCSGSYSKFLNLTEYEIYYCEYIYCNIVILYYGGYIGRWVCVCACVMYIAIRVQKDPCMQDHILNFWT